MNTWENNVWETICIDTLQGPKTTHPMQYATSSPGLIIVIDPKNMPMGPKQGDAAAASLRTTSGLVCSWRYAIITYSASAASRSILPPKRPEEAA